MDIRINGSVVFQDNIYETEQLNAMVVDIAYQIDKFGVGEEEVIALSMDRSPLLLTTIFALLKLRIPFLPIDITHASERVRRMLMNAGVDKILVDENRYQYINKEDSVQPILVRGQRDKVGNNRVFYTNECDANARTYKKYTSELGYILYTSGSTGTPKGVEVLRSGLENFLQSVPKIIQFPETTRIACFTNYTFDIFFLESVLALMEGFVVVLADESDRIDVKKMLQLIEKQKVNVIQMTPSAVQMIALIDPKLAGFQHLNTILVGGEDWKGNLFSLLKENTQAKLYNMFGPTETTIWSSIADVTDEIQLTIGHPINQTKIYLLDEQLQPVPDGMEGEICISGAGLAKGYRNANELTERSFCYQPFGDKERVYRTGDIGKRREDGLILYVGRMDEQIKVRGHRVELEEIEQSIMSVEGIDVAVVCYHMLDKGGELIAFYQSNLLLSNDDILNQLKERLPQYMLPRKLIKKESFSYTHSQKIDRKRMVSEYLAKQDTSEQSKVHPLVPETITKSNTEKIIIIMADILEDNKATFSEDTPMEQYAIDSLSYVNLVVRIEEEFGISLGEKALSQESFYSIKDLGNCIEEQLKLKEEEK